MGTKSFTYTNRLGRTYHLCEVTTSRGKGRYVFATEPRGRLVEAVPEGYEVVESISGQVSIRKARPSPIASDEVELVRSTTAKYRHVERCVVEVKEDAIIVHEPFSGPGAIDAIAQELVPTGSLRRSARWAPPDRYNPVIRFKLVDMKERRFSAHRMRYSGGPERWSHPLGFGTIGLLAERFVPHIGRESYFELM